VRVTDEATLNVVEMVLGEINQELVGLINRFGAKAVGLSGQDGRFIHARRWCCRRTPRTEAPRMRASSARSKASITDVIHLLVSRGFIPVIMPIGVGGDGTAYHINSDLFAGELARTLHAEKLILMTNVPGIHAGRQAGIRSLRKRGEALLRDGVVAPELRPRVSAALSAVREGVRSVHIIDGGVPSALLLEVLTNSGIGTAVRSDAGPHFLADSRSYFASAATNERGGRASASQGPRARRRAIEAADNGSVEYAQAVRRPQ
jgi:acetylglutamate kinase